MTTERRHLLVATAAAGLVALGCGAGAGPATSTGAPATPTPATGGLATPTPAAGGLATRASVDRARGVVDVVVTVTGPAAIQGGCEPPLSADLVDAAGLPVSTPTPAPGVRCLAIALIPVPAGATKDFTATVPIPPSGHGALRVVGQLRGSGPIPPVTVDV